jgi:WD40 repeat protein
MSDPNSLFFNLQDSSVIIFDIKKKKKLFNLMPGHSETIFDLEYNKLNYGTFATCSFDGSIKVWDLNNNKILCNYNTEQDKTPYDNKSISSLNSNSSIKISLYSLKWSPTNKDLLLTGDSIGVIRIIDTSKIKQLSKLVLNFKDNNQVVGIDWDYNDNILATCHDSAYVVKYENMKLSLVKVIKTNVSLYQIKFNPFDYTMFAAGSLDGQIRFFKDNNDKAYKVLSGHTKKAFGLSFNPKLKNIMASSSDDFKIGIWDLGKNSNFFLSGHTNNSRQLLWLNDFPNVLISGSWDGTIRIWNIDVAECIGLIDEHYSDVYGLGISPHHPFVLTSSSRDNSIRFWDILCLSKNLVKI